MPRDPRSPASAFRLGAWRVDPPAGEISRGDETLRLQPKVMEVLVLLARRAGEPVSKQELLGRVWADTHVTEDALWRCISDLRGALGDEARDPHYVETLPRRGYRLVAPVEFEPAPVVVGAPGASARAESRRLGSGILRRSVVPVGLAVVFALTALAFLRPIVSGPDDGAGAANGLPPVEYSEGPVDDPAAVKEKARPGAAAPGGVPTTAAEYLALALEYYRRYDRSDVEKAIRLLEHAVALDPAMAPAWAALADAYSVKADRFSDDRRWEDEGLRAARRAVRLDPELAAAHKALGFAHAVAGRVRESARASRRALELDPERFDAMHNLAHALASQGRPDEAIRWQRELIAAGFDNSDAFMTLGLFHTMIGDLTEARRALEASLQIHPFGPYASSTLAWIEIVEGDLEAARRLASSCLEVESGAPPCIHRLATLEQLAGNPHAARSLLEEALAAGNNTSWTPRLRLASVLDELGDRRRAETLLNVIEQQAWERLDAGSDHWSPRAKLAIVAARRGRRRKAMQWLDRAIDAGLVDYLFLSEDPLLRPFWDQPAFWSRVDELSRRAADMRTSIPTAPGPGS